MGQTISNIARAPTMTVSKEHYDNLLHKYQSQEENFKIYEASNKKLKNIIGERDAVIETQKRKLESHSYNLEVETEAKENLIKENKFVNNKINLGQKYYDDLKKEFDIASNALSDKDEIIYKNNSTIEEHEESIKKLNQELLSYKNDDKQQDLEITSLKEKNAELRKQAISTQEELNKFRQQFTLINNIVDKVID